VLSEFISNSHPSIVKIVSAAKDLKVESIRDKSLCDLIDLLRLLGLTSSLAEDHITLDVEVSLSLNVALDTNKASLLSMLKIVAVTFSNLAIHCLLYPSNLIN